MILGRVEDKHCFSTLSLMKSKLQNRLSTHVDLVVTISTQEHYSLDIFLFGGGHQELD
jgi:hypothetical protein